MFLLKSSYIKKNINFLGVKFKEYINILDEIDKIKK